MSTCRRPTNELALDNSYSRTNERVTTEGFYVLNLLRPYFEEKQIWKRAKINTSSMIKCNLIHNF